MAEAAGMRTRDPERPGVDRNPGAIHCAACGDVIGVYEPLVRLHRGLASHTSRAAEPGISAAVGRCYHLACYEALDGPGAAADNADPGQAGAS